MPLGSVILRPGVNVEMTPSLNEAGISQSQLVRFKQNLIEKVGGWQSLFGTAIGSTVRDVHPWGDLQSIKFLGLGATQSLTVYNSNNGALKDITPQTETRNFTPDFSVSSGTNLVKIIDAGSSVSTYQTVFFNTQVAVGTLLLQGAYKVNTVLGSSAYTILATANSCTTVASSGILPTFTTGANSAVVTVELPNNGYQSIVGLDEQFIAATSVAGITIQGPYEISSVVDSTDFTITLTFQASAAATSTMNAGQAQLVYYRTQGPVPFGSGFGYGGFGTGGFGTGVTVTGGSTGTPITATDWTMDNWGGVLLACPSSGPIYTWSNESAFNTAAVIPQAPFFNGGIFVSMPQQILVAWQSTQSTGVHDPLIVRWCDAEDFTNWTVSNQTSAGSFHIPTGSRIVGGMQGPTQGIISTDVDVWVMQYVGGSIIFNFNRVGSGCGWVGPHAAGVLGGNIFWCGGNNFFMLNANGVQDIPCPVWDFFFQNLNKAQAAKVQCAPNSLFNEISWYFPSTNATECDSYVKLNTSDGAWDYGTLDRTAWTDASLLGNPIGSDHQGFVWQHELTMDAGGTPMAPSFRSGYWRIQEGNDLAFVDLIIPDMKFGLYSNTTTSATLQITFFAVDFLGDTPRTYGPYLFTNTTEYINTRIRGRFLAVQITSADSGSFWRLGRINYRWQPAGRR